MDKSNIKIRRQISGFIFKWLIFILLFSGIILSSSCRSSGDSELTRNEKLWQSQNLTSYDFTLTRQCFCPEDWRGPVKVQVRDGKAFSVTYLSNGAPVTEAKFENADTIDKLFTILKNAYAGKGDFVQKADTINVDYSAQMGYPETFFIDVSQNMADEEQGYTVTNLVVKIDS